MLEKDGHFGLVDACIDLERFKSYLSGISVKKLDFIILTHFHRDHYGSISDIVKTFPVLSKGFEIETEMSIHAIDKNMQVENVVIDYRDRPEGSESKLNTFSDGFKVLRTILRLFRNYKPMVFFGIIAFILAAISLGFFIPVFAEYIETGLVPKFPTLITCGFMMIAAIQSFFVGLTLETMVQKNRQDFEMQLITCSQRLKTQKARKRKQKKTMES